MVLGVKFDYFWQLIAYFPMYTHDIMGYWSHQCCIFIGAYGIFSYVHMTSGEMQLAAL